MNNTPIAGKDEFTVIVNSLPYEGSYHMFFYDEEECESPGVIISVRHLRKESSSYGEVYHFLDKDDKIFEFIIN